MLERVEALKLSRPVSWHAWDAVGVAAVRSEVMSPADGLKLWYELRAHEPTLGAVPLVIDDKLRFEADTDTKRPPPRYTSAAAFFDARADTIARTTEAMVELDLVPAAAVSRNMTWSDFRAWCSKLDKDSPQKQYVYCAEKDYVGEELQQLATATLKPVAQPREPSFDFATRNELHADIGRRNGIDMPQLRVRMVIVTARPHELPIHLHIGGWNESPLPEEHALVLEDWYRRFGARPIFYGGDILELHVERPPTRAADVKRLAREQFLYCEDIVTQGVGTATELANVLAGARGWYFWWD